MKMVKSLLLGSAAGLVAVAGAQAADLPVKAKPVQYVKICTLYGDGFYYIPGTDTCIKFQGYIRADYGFNVSGARQVHYFGANGLQDRTVSRHSTRHRTNFQIDTRTQTAYGTIRTFSSHHFNAENETTSVIAARAFVQWAGFTFGRTASYTDQRGTIGDSGMRSLHQNQIHSDSGANGTNQIAYTWQLGNGITLNIGADERRVAPVGNLQTAPSAIGGDTGNSRAGMSHPNPWIALRGNQAWGGFSLSVIGNKNEATYYTGTVGTCGGNPTGTSPCGHPDDKWGFAFLAGTEIKLPQLGPGDRVGAYFGYSVGATRYAPGSNLRGPALYSGTNDIAIGYTSDAVYRNGTDLELTTGWSAGGGYEHFWTRNFSSTIYGAYAEVKYNNTVVNGAWFCGNAIVLLDGQRCDPSFQYWVLGSHTDWWPVPNFRLAVDVMYTQVETAFAGRVLLPRNGSRVGGIYNAKDLGITSVIFRAQRNWGGR
jgi:hypothetical protein